MTPETRERQRSSGETRSPVSRALLTTGLVAAAGSGAAGAVLTVVTGPVTALGIVVGLVLIAACAWRPLIATYVYIATLPIIAGIDRAAILPLVRPNELLLGLLLAGAAFGGYLRFARGATVPLRPHPVDIPLALFVVLSTVWPIASLLLRGQAVTPDDIVAVLPMVKLAALLLLVRLTVTRHEQIVRCIRLVIWPAVVLAVVAILQAVQFGPVIAMLSAVWGLEETAEGPSQRGSSMLASSIATGDYILIALTLVLCCAARGLMQPRERWGAGLVLAAGVLAAGQFSAWISALVVAALIAWQYPWMLRRAMRYWPLGLLALAAGAPALISRLQGFGEGFGVPRSWLGRWDNLANLYWPQFDATGFLIGVSPDPVLQAPETWRDVVYLESGYLQFVWIGGIPLLLGFVWLAIAVIRHARAASTSSTAVGVCASAALIVWWFVLALSVIDPHLTLRGAGDLIFVLLGLLTARIDARGSHVTAP